MLKRLKSVSMLLFLIGANEKLNDCIAACDRIITSGNFDLKDDYKMKFMYTNGSQIKDFKIGRAHV